MSNYVGIPSNNPSKYLGPNVSLVSLVSRNREPTGADIRQGSTGTYYPLGSLWLVSKDPTTGTEGEIFALSKIVANVAFWSKIGALIGQVEKFEVDASTPPGTDPVLPDGDFTVTVTGGQIAAGSTPNAIQTNSLAANTFTIQIQRASAVAATDITLNGICHFDSSHFSVSADGFVSLLGSGQAIDSFTVPSGTSPVVPDANGNIDLSAGNGFAFTGATNAITGNMVSPFEGDFAFTQTNNPSTDPRRLVVSNNDTANAISDAALITSVGGSNSGDSYTLNSIASSHAWASGPDTSDSGNYKINYAAASSVSPSSGTNIVQMTTSGIVTKPLQPMFYARLGSNLSNITGDGTQLTIIYDSVTRQVGGTNYDNTTGVFTAPVDGTYLFTFSLNIIGLTSAHTEGLFLLGINGTTIGVNLTSGLVSSFAAMRSINNNIDASGSYVNFLNAGDTAECSLKVTGGAKVVGAQSLTQASFFSGALLF